MSRVRRGEDNSDRSSGRHHAAHLLAILMILTQHGRSRHSMRHQYAAQTGVGRRCWASWAEAWEEEQVGSDSLMPTHPSPRLYLPHHVPSELPSVPREREPVRISPLMPYVGRCGAHETHTGTNYSGLN